MILIRCSFFSLWICICGRWNQVIPYAHKSIIHIYIQLKHAHSLDSIDSTDNMNWSINPLRMHSLCGFAELLIDTHST